MIDLLPWGLLAILSFPLHYLLYRTLKRGGIFVDSHDSAKPQRSHHVATPRAGGLGVFGVIVVGWWLSPALQGGVLVALTLAFASGIMEDFKGTLTPKNRLYIQLLAALVAVAMGGMVRDLGVVVLPWWLGVAFSLVAMVGMMNAMNIIDGFNGLSGGVALGIIAVLGVAAWRVGDSELVSLALLCGVALLGFLWLNFPRGRIFLGDGGAYLLGLVIAYMAMSLSERHAEISPWFALAVLIYPVYEVLFSIYRRRVVRNRSAFAPDSLHLHSLLYRRYTKNNPRTSVILWIFIAPFLLAPLLVADNGVALVGIIAVFVLVYGELYRGIVRFRFPALRRMLDQARP